MASTTTNLGLTKPAYTDDADVAVINANSDIIDAAYGSLSDQIANVQKGTYYLPNSHCVYAGRNGWGGLNIRTIIPINKGTSGISSATINLSGATVYACTANGVYDITSNISSISCYFSGTGILTAVAVTIVLSSNPLPFNDGIVNISINGGTPTITFA